MPNPDLILAPPVGLLSSNSIIFVVPGTLVGEVGAGVITNRVSLLALDINSIRNRGLSNAVASEHFPFDIDTTLGDLFDNPQRVDLRPPNFSTLLQDAGLPALVGQDRPLPSRTNVVVYFDPDIPLGTAQTHVYNEEAVTGTGRSTITVIRVNGDTPFGDHGEALPDIAQGLLIASELRARTYNGQTQALARRLGDALSRRFRIQPDEVTLPDFTSTNETDRIGFSQVVRDVNLTNRDGTPLADRTVVADSRGSELGKPMLQLVWRAGRLDFEIRALTSRDYASPELYIARNLLLKAIRESAPGTSLYDILRTYDGRIIQELGNASLRYRLVEGEGIDLRTIVATSGNDRAAYADVTPSLMIRYRDIDSEAFREGISSPVMRQAYDRAVQVGGQLFSEFRRYIISGFFSTHPIVLSEELRAFFIHTIFSEMQIQALGANPTPAQADVILHASPSDAVFSVLSAPEVNSVAIWFNRLSIQRVISQILQNNGLDARPGTDSFRRIREAFFVAPRERLDSEHAQLWIDPEAHWAASPVPGGNGRLVYHYMVGGQERRPVVVDRGEYHIEVSYTSDTGTFSHLWNGFDTATPNEAVRLLGELVPDLTLADPYAQSVSEMERAAAPILSYDVAQEGPAGLLRLIRDFVDRLPGSPAFLDDQGRVAQADAGWWRRAKRIGLKVRSKARSINENGLAGELSQRFREAFHQNLDAPGPGINEVRFENGQFHTWRGEVGDAELGLPEGWRPGDAIAGYQTSISAHGFYEYTLLGGESTLPERFTMSWNGLSWPTAAFTAGENLQPQSTQIATFTDDREGTQVVRRIELPSGFRQFPGTDGRYFVYQIRSLDNLLVFLDAYDFVSSDGDTASAARGMAQMRKQLHIFKRTQLGGEALDRVADLPRLSSSQIDPSARLAGVSYSELMDDREATAVIQVTADGYRLNLLTPGGSRRLTLNQGDHLDHLLLDTLTLGNGIETLQVPEGEDARTVRLRRLFELDNQINSELGLPLRFRIHEGDTSSLVPLDGSVVLWDENNQPISVVLAWEETLANRYIEAFMERARRIFPDISDIRVGDSDMGQTVSVRMRQVLERVGDDTSWDTLVEELHFIKRQLLESADRIRQAREGVPRDNSLGLAPEEPFRILPDKRLPQGDGVIESARTAWETWSRRRYAALGSGELTEAGKVFLVHEVSLISAGIREYTEIQLLYDGLTEVQQGFLLSNMVVVLDRAEKTGVNVSESLSYFLGRNFDDLKRVNSEIRLARIDERNRDTINRGIVAPEEIWEQNREAQRLIIPDDSRLVYFYRGVQVDQRGGAHSSPVNTGPGRCGYGICDGHLWR